jgi:ribosomal protein L29
MKRNDLKEIKRTDTKEIFLRVAKIKEEIANIKLDRFNSTKSKQATNLKDIYEKRKDIAQMLTIARQKQILAELQPVEEVKSEKKLKVENKEKK